VAELGIHGMPSFGDRPKTLDEYRRVLDMLPPAFTSAWVSDHLQEGEGGYNEAWTTLTYLAALYPRLRFGNLVLSQSYRNPALLAKMAATLAAFSGGRLVMGLGAGWLQEEYVAYGYPFPRAGIRVAQLAETIQILKAMWTQWPATFEGEHYAIHGAYCDPRPAAPIPVLVGTNGPKALRVVAEYADWWSWDGPWEATYRTPYETLRAHCADIGRPFEEMTLVAELTISMPDDPATFEGSYTNEVAYPGQAFPIVGPRPEDVIREIETLVDHGVAHVVISVDTLADLQRFIDEVVPAVRLTRATAAGA
jgi:alkanesulfonate monooxygenase SsuD/methylene tetrahydromethanopterin reductase-like flavin-dependent oxidoreductase (luciferase family)